MQYKTGTISIVSSSIAIPPKTGIAIGSAKKNRGNEYITAAAR
jgi:hypothetical protein